MNVLRLEEVTSTQDVAKELAAEGAPHGLIVRAEVQTAGRGRLARRWESDRGQGLLFSMVLRPSCALREAPLLTLGAAAGMASVLGVQVKWPNDLVVDRGGGRPAKVGGVLGELEADGANVRHVVLGIGLNVRQTQFPLELPDATSLAMEGLESDLDRVFERAVAAILQWHAHPDRLELWKAHAHTLGRRVTIRAMDGERAGVATGLADDGALLVDGVPVHVGEVS